MTDFRVPPDRPDAEDEFSRLLAEARSGSREATGQLVESCRAYLLLVANQDLDRSLRAKLGASDLVQESLWCAQNKIGDFQGQSQTELVAWLRGILVNDILTTRRRYRGTAKRQIDREVPLKDRDGARGGDWDVASDSATPGTMAAAAEEAAALHAAMTRLPEDYREVLRLRNWQQLPFEDIGKRMGRSAEAARKLWSRALLQLQEELNAYVGPDRSSRD